MLTILKGNSLLPPCLMRDVLDKEKAFYKKKAKLAANLI
jgi:hypothetical protein